MLADNANEIDNRVASGDCKVEIWGENVTLNALQAAGTCCSFGDAGAAAIHQSAHFVSIAQQAFKQVRAYESSCPGEEHFHCSISRSRGTYGHSRAQTAADPARYSRLLSTEDSSCCRKLMDSRGLRKQPEFARPYAT